MTTIQLDPANIDDYRKFIAVKSLPCYSCRGREMTFPDEYNGQILGRKAKPRFTNWEPSPFLFDYQRDITKMALRKRKYAIFADCGAGKTLMFLEWCHAVRGMLPKRKRLLIVSPLMVCQQTIDENEKWYANTGYPIEQVRSADLDAWLGGEGGIGITNYDALTDEITQKNLGAMVLDESSMLKSHYGKWGQKCIELGRGLDFKLACTGTPAPNDRIEYANHAVFLDRFPTVNSFLARFFINRGQTQNRWELKQHALAGFYRALSHWCIFLTNPATYGWRDNTQPLPPINVSIDHVPLTPDQTKIAQQATGNLMTTGLGGITSRSMFSQLAKGIYKGDDVPTNKFTFIKSLVDSFGDKSTIIWCHYNDEQDRVAAMFPDAANIDGSTPMKKRLILLDWFCGRICTCERNRRLGNTESSTTSQTSISGQREPESSETNTTKNGESNTPRAKKQKQSSKPTLRNGSPQIHENGSISECGDTEFQQKSMSQCFHNSTDSAPYADSRRAEADYLSQDCMSITATQQTQSEDCCVPTATTGLGNSKTIQRFSKRPQCICDQNSKGRVMISKPKVLGFGLNLQVATKQVFSGLHDSYEEYYQAVKRSNRYGSTEPLDVHIPVTELEEPFVENVLRKAGNIQRDTEEQERIFREYGYLDGLATAN